MSIKPIAPYALPAPGSWPACRAPFALEPARAALLVHDMQEYFLEPYGEGSPLTDMIGNVRSLLGSFRALAAPVIFSAQPGEQSRAERGLLWDMWGKGIVEKPGLEGLSHRLPRSPDDLLLAKRRYSAFHGTELLELLTARGKDQLVICGVYGHIGCLASAVDAFMLGVQPFMVSDAVADFSREDHDVALRQVARTCGVVSTTSDVVKKLSVPVRSTLFEAQS